MKSTFSFLVKAFIVSAALAASGATHAIAIVNPGFEAVTVATSSGYAYQEQVRVQPSPVCPNNPCQDFNNAAGFGWTLVGLTGLTIPGTAFNPPTNFIGQAAFLQGWDVPTVPETVPTISQSLSGFIAGATYQLSFDLGSRQIGGNQQSIEALIDATVIGSWTVQSLASFSTVFQVFGNNAGGTHTLTFRGANPPGDNTAFIDNVAVELVPLPVPEPSSLALLAIGLAGAGIARRRKRIAALCLALAASTNANAALFDRGNGLIYDDALNITWLADLNYAKTTGQPFNGAMTWDGARAWVDNLTYGGYSDWRLPKALDPDPSCSFRFGFGEPPIGTPGLGVNCGLSEIAHLFNIDLGAVWSFFNGIPPWLSGDPDVALFTNLAPDAAGMGIWWYGTEYSLDPTQAWAISGEPVQFRMSKTTFGLYAIAVRDGDVLNAAPEPGVLWLLGIGLALACLRSSWPQGKRGPRFPSAD